MRSRARAIPRLWAQTTGVAAGRESTKYKRRRSVTAAGLTVVGDRRVGVRQPEPPHRSFHRNAFRRNAMGGRSGHQPRTRARCARCTRAAPSRTWMSARVCTDHKYCCSSLTKHTVRSARPQTSRIQKFEKIRIDLLVPAGPSVDPFSTFSRRLIIQHHPGDGPRLSEVSGTYRLSRVPPAHRRIIRPPSRMPLGPGCRLGDYEVVPLGAGGMGGIG